MLTQQAWDVAMRRRFNFKFTSSKRPFLSPHPEPVEDESRYYNFDDTLVPIRPDSPLTDRQEIDPTTLVHLRHACILLYQKVKSQGQAVRRVPIPQSDPVYFQREYERRKLAALPPGRRPMGPTEESIAAPEAATSRPDTRPRPLIMTDLPSSSLSSSLSPTSALVAPNSAGVVTDQPSSTDMEIRRTISAPPHTETGVIMEDPSFPYTSENCQVPSADHMSDLPASPTRPTPLSPVASPEARPKERLPTNRQAAGAQSFEDSDTETLSPTEVDMHQHESTPRPINQSMGLVPVPTQASAQRTSSSTTNSTTNTTMTTASTSTDITPPPTAPTTGQLSRAQAFVKKLSKFGFNKKKASSISRSNVGLGMVVEAT